MFVESDTIFQNEFGHDFQEVWDSIDLKDTHVVFKLSTRRVGFFCKGI